MSYVTFTGNIFLIGGFADFVIIIGQSLPSIILRPNRVGGGNWSWFRLDSKLDVHLLHLMYFKNTRNRIKGVVCTLIFLSAMLRVVSAANIKLIIISTVSNRQFSVVNNTNLD